MIIGLGTDIIEVDRIRKSIMQYGALFLNKMYSVEEQEYCESRPNRFERYAVRFAAKEAFSKAVGTGWAGHFAWRDVSVGRSENGKPHLILLNELGRYWNGHRIHLTLSHTHRYATATVIIEK